MASSVSQNIVWYKIVILGDSGVGKSTFLRRFVNANMGKSFITSVGACVFPIVLKTNKGTIGLNVWDTTGQEAYGCLKDEFFYGVDSAVIMFDLTSRISFQHVEKWQQNLPKASLEIPTVFCGTKRDVKDRKVSTISIAFHRDGQPLYCEICAFANHNVTTPFILLAQKLLGFEHIQLMSLPILATPTVVMDPTRAEKYNHELEVMILTQERNLERNRRRMLEAKVLSLEAQLADSKREAIFLRSRMPPQRS